METCVQAYTAIRIEPQHTQWKDTNHAGLRSYTDVRLLKLDNSTYTGKCKEQKTVAEQKYNSTCNPWEIIRERALSVTVTPQKGFTFNKA